MLVGHADRPLLQITPRRAYMAAAATSPRGPHRVSGVGGGGGVHSRGPESSWLAPRPPGVAADKSIRKAPCGRGCRVRQGQFGPPPHRPGGGQDPGIRTRRVGEDVVIVVVVVVVIVVYVC